MKASSAYRTQIIKDSLEKEAESVLELIAHNAQAQHDLYIKAPQPRRAEARQNAMAAIRPIIDRLDEIHKMLTEKK